MLAKCFQVVTQARHVAVNLAANRDGMRYAQRFELTDCKFGYLNRVIYELVIVRNLVATVAIRFCTIALH